MVTNIFVHNLVEGVCRHPRGDGPRGLDNGACGNAASPANRLDLLWLVEIAVLALAGGVTPNILGPNNFGGYAKAWGNDPRNELPRLVSRHP